ncbi:hypothetical protein evm_014767 [Chilo suppressalis]|nr:hypothetical protein evm_014767 [Chilo suppressalis]
MNNSSDFILYELHCSKDALTDNYGWFMQFLLAVLAFTCLIGKRFCEPRYARRPWLIWFYDTSKQGLGALIIHAANVWLSPHLTGNPCTWYIVNFMLDSTLGLLIIWAGIRLAQYWAREYDIPLINFGEYDPFLSGLTASANHISLSIFYLGLVYVKIMSTLYICQCSQLGIPTGRVMGRAHTRPLLPALLRREGAARGSSSRSLSVASFYEMTFLQKEAAAFHAVSLLSMASTMLLSEKAPPLSAAIRSQRCCSRALQQGVLGSIVRGAAMMALRRFLPAGDTVQVVTEASVSGQYLHYAKKRPPHRLSAVPTNARQTASYTDFAFAATMVSSAKQTTSMLGRRLPRSTQLYPRFQGSGPSTDPWGTPAAMAESIRFHRAPRRKLTSPAGNPPRWLAGMEARSENAVPP